MYRLVGSIIFLFALTLQVGCSKEVESEADVSNISSSDSSVVVKLKMASAFPSTLAILGEAPVQWVETVREVSGGTLDIKFFEPNALVPALEAIPAAGKGSVEMAWASSGYYAGVDNTFSVFATLPFGPSPTEFLAWFYYGDGQKLADELYGRQQIKYLPCHMIPPEASGWFKKEIRSVEDLRGLKMRFFGLGAKVLDRLGVATQLLAGGDTFPALQLGTIDATEYSMPSTDESVGFYQVAKHYYFPGWHQPASFNGVFFNLDVWNSLSSRHQRIIEVACGDSVRDGLAMGDASQPAALDRMRQKGVQIHYWPPEIIAAYRSAWDEVARDEMAENPNFKRVYENLQAFRNQFSIWRDNAYLD